MSIAILCLVVGVLVKHQHQARELWTNLTRVPFSSLALALLLCLCQFGCQALRLWVLIPRDVHVTLLRTTYAFAVGQWFNILVPARAGDAAKVILVNRNATTPTSVATVTGALFADKIVDVGSLVLLCATLGMARLMRAATEARLPGLGLIAATGVVLGLALLGLRLAPPRLLAKMTALRRELVRGMAALKDPVRLLFGLSVSLGAYLAEALALGVLCAAFGFPLSLPQIVLALGVLNLGIGIPISVANLGVYEAVLAFALSESGVALPSAVAIATLHHALQLLSTNLATAVLALWVTARGQS
ncbi:MAG TPA: lysylphosphatidylglycerol synthase transmembrane domain-containing protein [Gemmatimonadales bacterium]|nr:lysylphosphatidylglycerol synthase transmembrane domain-containing protein [Gemmatimonadales bacterium]